MAWISVQEDGLVVELAAYDQSSHVGRAVRMRAVSKLFSRYDAGRTTVFAPARVHCCIKERTR